MNKNPIGVFDSGVGGISVLRELKKIMPNENYIYFGDSRNAPYGGKTTEEVRELSLGIAGYLIELGAKAIVVACNTATSASVRILREMYPDKVVIGVEPAVKPAVLYKKNSRILVLATPVTLREAKFKELASRFEKESEIVAVPMDELARLIETDAEREEIKKYLENTLSPYFEKKVDSIVLGCTHYPFAKEIIAEIAGNDVKIFDGGEGVARETKRQLEMKNSLNTDGGEIRFICSDNSDKLSKFASKYIK